MLHDPITIIVVWEWNGINFKEGQCFWTGKQIHMASFFPHLLDETWAAQGKQHFWSRFFTWDFEAMTTASESRYKNLPFLLLLESILYFHKCCMFCISLSRGLSWFHDSLTLLRLRSQRKRNQILSLGQSSDNNNTHSQHFDNSVQFMQCFNTWTLGPRLFVFLLECSIQIFLLFIQSSTQCHLPWLPLWADLLYSCAFFPKPSTLSEITLSFCFPCWIPLSTLECQPHKDRDLLYYSCLPRAKNSAWHIRNTQDFSLYWWMSEQLLLSIVVLKVVIFILKMRDPHLCEIKTSVWSHMTRLWQNHNLNRGLLLLSGIFWWEGKWTFTQNWVMLGALKSKFPIRGH